MDETTVSSDGPAYSPWFGRDPEAPSARGGFWRLRFVLETDNGDQFHVRLLASEPSDPEEASDE